MAQITIVVPMGPLSGTASDVPILAGNSVINENTNIVPVPRDTGVKDVPLAERTSSSRLSANEDDPHSAGTSSSRLDASSTSPTNELELAWELVLKLYRYKCKDANHLDGFSMFSFRPRAQGYGIDVKAGAKKFNCIYRFVPRDSFFWNSSMEVVYTEERPRPSHGVGTSSSRLGSNNEDPLGGKKPLEIYNKTKNYMICVCLHSHTGDDTISIKLFDISTDKPLPPLTP
jgi:hypothetical protein